MDGYVLETYLGVQGMQQVPVFDLPNVDFAVLAAGKKVVLETL